MNMRQSPASGRQPQSWSPSTAPLGMRVSVALPPPKVKSALVATELTVTGTTVVVVPSETRTWAS